MSKQTILVAGATGMLGSALVGRLLALNYVVVALVRTGSGFRRPIAASSANLKIVEVPAIESAALKHALDGIGIDLIVNCIASGIDPKERDADTLWRGNVTPVMALIAFAGDAGVRRFIHTGSEAEYGRATAGRRIGEDHPILPFSSYGAAKAASVSYAAAFAQMHGVELLVLRPFYLFGPGERSHRLLPSIAAAKVSGRLVPMSSGEQLRDLLYVDDAAEAYVAAITAGWPDRVTVCNLCSGQPKRIREVAELVATVFGVPRSLLKWGALPDRETDAPWIVGDPSRLESMSGWRSSLSLEQGIERWMRDRSSLETA